MTVRGTRTPIPSKGKQPSGIFSTRGTQKQDGAFGPNMAVLSAAHSSKRSGAPRSTGGQNLRHQPPRKS